MRDKLLRERGGGKGGVCLRVEKGPKTGVLTERRGLPQRKWEVYTQFADIVNDVFQSAKAGRADRDLRKHTRKLDEFTSQLWIVGSDEVVEAFNEGLRDCRRSDEGKTGEYENLVKFSQVIIEMRKDLGYKASGVGPRDLLTTFLKDIEEHG